MDQLQFQLEHTAAGMELEVYIQTSLTACVLMEIDRFQALANMDDKPLNVQEL